MCYNSDIYIVEIVDFSMRRIITAFSVLPVVNIKQDSQGTIWRYS